MQRCITAALIALACLTAMTAAADARRGDREPRQKCRTVMVVPSVNGVPSSAWSLKTVCGRVRRHWVPS